MKTTYWISTTVLCLFLLWSAYTYVFSRATIDGVRELGFPNFFRVQLAVLKVIAVILILMPQIPIVAKEWAYAGVFLFLVTAIVAHTVHKDPFVITIINVVLIGLVVVSNIWLHKIN